MQFVRKNKNKQSKSTLRMEIPPSFVAPPKSRDYSRATKANRFETTPFSGAKTNSIVTQGSRAREEDRVMFFVYASSSNEELPKLSFRARTKFCKRTKKERNVAEKIYFLFVMYFSSREKRKKQRKEISKIRHIDAKAMRTKSEIQINFEVILFTEGRERERERE